MTLHSLTNTFSSILLRKIEHSPTKIDRLVVAYSGGVDSHVLLHQAVEFARTQTEIEVCAVYVNHGLSLNSTKWQAHCAQVCNELTIPLHVEKVDIYPQSRQSLEKLARDARYKALASYVTPHTILLTGQHADDQVETFLLALKRGSGPKGLASMAVAKSFASGQLVRPLVTSTRKDIEQYANEHALQWIEDESNRDVAFDRNFLRADVVPKLTERWPQIHKTVQRSAELCNEQETLLNELLQDKLTTALNHDGSLSILFLHNQSPLVRNRLLRMWFEKNNTPMPSASQLDEIWLSVALARIDATPILQLQQHSVRRFNQALHLVSAQQSVTQFSSELAIGQSITLPDGLGTISIVEKDEAIDMSEVKAVHTLTLNNLQQPITVQFSTAGLIAHPSQRSRSRKMKKLWQELQVPTWERGRFPVLLSDQQVIAVAGLFVDINFVGYDYHLIWKK
jgi:tRNA(Ile)-lysidine synthase